MVVQEPSHEHTEEEREKAYNKETRGEKSLKRNKEEKRKRKT